MLSRCWYISRISQKIKDRQDIIKVLKKTVFSYNKLRGKAFVLTVLKGPPFSIPLWTFLLLCYNGVHPFVGISNLILRFCSDLRDTTFWIKTPRESNCEISITLWDNLTHRPTLSLAHFECDLLLHTFYAVLLPHFCTINENTNCWKGYSLESATL